MARRWGRLSSSSSIDKLLGPDITFNHCGTLPESTWQNLTNQCHHRRLPALRFAIRARRRIPCLQHALDHGMKPGFSIDNETSYSHRHVHGDAHRLPHPARASRPTASSTATQIRRSRSRCATCSTCATVNGAACAGLFRQDRYARPRQGSRYRPDSHERINLYPSNNAIGTVVAAADAAMSTPSSSAAASASCAASSSGFDWRRFRAAWSTSSRAYLFEQAAATNPTYSPRSSSSRSDARL